MQEVEDTHIHVPTTLDDDNSVASTITRSTVSIASSERRKMQLMDKYGTGKTTDYNKSTLQSFNRAVRKVLLPRMKFVSNSKSFATFEQPGFQIAIVEYIKSLISWESSKTIVTLRKLRYG